MTPTRRRARAVWMQETFQIAVCRACRLAGYSRAAWYKPRRTKDQSALRLRIRELAIARPQFGYQRIHILLRREGWHVNKKRVRRLYRLEGLQLRMRVRRLALHRGPARLLPPEPMPDTPSRFRQLLATGGKNFRINANHTKTLPIIDATGMASRPTTTEFITILVSNAPDTPIAGKALTDGAFTRLSA